MTAEFAILLLTALPALLFRGTRSLLLPSFGRVSSDTPASITPSERSLPVDAARALAIFAVLVIHALYLPAFSPGLPLNEWVPATLINNLLRFAVPAFLLFSGFCLMPPPATPSGWFRFYLRKILRIFLPYAILSAILVLYSTGELSLTKTSSFDGSWNWLLALSLSPSSIHSVATSILCGSASTPFYFLVVLFQLYILYPILRPLAHRFPFALSASALIISVTLAIPELATALRAPSGFPLFLPYLYPFVLGMCLSSTRYRLDSAPTPALWITPVLYLALNAIVAILLNVGVGTASAEGFYSYNCQYFYSTTLALLLCSILSTSPRLGRMLAPTGRLSLWVFLLHFPIQQAVWAWLAPSSSPSALGLSLVLALVSVVVAWGLCSLIVRFHHPPR